jgi:CBS domain-containing protein
MGKVNEIMSTDVQVVGPEQTLLHAAQLMRRLNVASLPVCAGRRLLGVVTDRDIAVRGTAAGLSPTGARVSDVMNRCPSWCLEDQDTVVVLRRMGQEHVLRLPVVNAEEELVGMVSLADPASWQSTSAAPPARDMPPRG